MKKCFIVFCLFAATVLVSSAQTKKGNFVIDKSQFVAYYHFYVHTTDQQEKQVTDTCDMALMVGRKVIKFFRRSTFLVDSLTQNTGGAVDSLRRHINEKHAAGNYKIAKKDSIINKLLDTEIIDESFDVPIIYQNYPAGQMTVYDTMFPHFYVYQEKMDAGGWTLSDETQTICGYSCKKAVLAYGGRIWNAWYSEDIPASTGPWKFYGLPGFVLKAEDSTGTLSMTLYSLFKCEMPISLVPKANEVKMKHETFVKFKNDFIHNPKFKKEGYFTLVNMANIHQVTVIKSGSGASMIVDDMPPVSMAMHMPVPLELK